MNPWDPAFWAIQKKHLNKATSKHQAKKKLLKLKLFYKESRHVIHHHLNQPTIYTNDMNYSYRAIKEWLQGATSFNLLKS